MESSGSGTTDVSNEVIEGSPKRHEESLENAVNLIHADIDQLRGEVLALRFLASTLATAFDGVERGATLAIANSLNSYSEHLKSELDHKDNDLATGLIDCLSAMPEDLKSSAERLKTLPKRTGSASATFASNRNLSPSEANSILENTANVLKLAKIVEKTDE